MNKKYFILAFSLCLFFVISGFAQTQRAYRADTIRDSRGNIIGSSFFEIRVSPGASREEIMESVQSQKISFFTRYIGFTPQEAQLFWPIYNEYIDKLQKVENKRRRLLSILTSDQLMTMDDKTVKTNLDAYVQCDTEKGQLNAEYHKKFSGVLNPKKIVRLYQAEEQFTRDLLRQLQGRY